VAWDDPGFHILSTDSVDAVKDLNRYQYNIHKSNLPRINNYDIIYLQESDEDMYAALTRFWRTDCALPRENVQPLRRAA